MTDFELDPDTLVGTFEGEFDTLSLEETAMRAAEEREVRNLVANAGTKRETTVEEFGIDALRECIHRLRHAGFADRGLDYEELYSDSDVEEGALILASAAPIGDVVPSAFGLIKTRLSQLDSLGAGGITHGETYEVDGYLVEPMHHAPAGVVLVVDVAALARHPSALDRALVRDPNGIAVLTVQPDEA